MFTSIANLESKQNQKKKQKKGFQKFGPSLVYEKTFWLSSHTPRYSLMSCPGQNDRHHNTKSMSRHHNTKGLYIGIIPLSVKLIIFYEAKNHAYFQFCTYPFLLFNFLFLNFYSFIKGFQIRFIVIHFQEQTV